MLRGLHEEVQWAVEKATEAIASDDPVIAQEVIDAKPEINRLTDDAEAHLSSRLTAAAPNRLAVFRLETELVEALKRIYYVAKRVARLVVDANPETAETGVEDEADQETVDARDAEGEGDSARGKDKGKKGKKKTKKKKKHG